MMERKALASGGRNVRYGVILVSWPSWQECPCALMSRHPRAITAGPKVPRADIVSLRRDVGAMSFIVHRADLM